MLLSRRDGPRQSPEVVVCTVFGGEVSRLGGQKLDGGLRSFFRELKQAWEAFEPLRIARCRWQEVAVLC